MRGRSSTGYAVWGKKSEQFHTHLCLTGLFILHFVQMDEVWSYLKRKKCQLWVFISFEVASRFWLGFELGARTLYTANRLVAQFKRFGNWVGEKILKVTTDKLAAYKKALEKQFTNNLPPGGVTQGRCRNGSSTPLL